MKELPAIPEELMKLLKELYNKDPQEFPKKGPLEGVSTEHGVYIIKNLKKEIMHVGRTLRVKNGLMGRLSGHLYGNSSFTQNHKGEPRNVRDGYFFQYIEVEEDNIRALLESLAIGWLSPKHLGDGRKGKVKVPNKATRKAMQDTRLRRNLARAKNTSEMMRQLKIKL